jgi:phage terminase small subunit
LTKKKLISKAKPKSKVDSSVLNDKQKQFCLEYLVDFNATKSAIRAGYSQRSAYAIGWANLRIPEIRKHIDALLEERSLGKHEVLKLLSDIAQGSLSDYFITTTKVHTPQIKKTLKELIKELREKIEDQRKLIARAKITDSDRLKVFASQEIYRFEQIAAYEIELERNPRAYRIVDGETQFVEAVELDMAKLVKDKERGRIKTLVPNEYGFKIELYPADAALRDLGRYHGIFEKDNEQGKPTFNIEGQQIVFK